MPPANKTRRINEEAISDLLTYKSRHISKAHCGYPQRALLIVPIYIFASGLDAKEKGPYCISAEIPLSSMAEHNGARSS